MSRHRPGLCCLVLAMSLVAACQDVNVVTQHNDLSRTGAYLAETTFTPRAIRDRGINERFRLPQCKGPLSFDDTRPVEPPRPSPSRDARPCLNGPIITQPLYVHGVDFRRKNETANGVFLATQWDWVYGVNAQTGAWEWATDLLRDNTGAHIQPECQWTGGKCGTGWLARGVNSAPVIDPGANRMYVLFSTRLELNLPVNCAGVDEGRCRYFHHLVQEADVNYWLVVLDLRDGVELNRVRVGAGARARKSDGTWLSFDDRQQLDRPGLLLDRGSIYAGFGADAGIEGLASFHGWVLKYRAGDLALQAAFCTSPNSPRASGIWQGGGGLAADGQGRVFFLTGNGPSPSLGSRVLQPLHPHPANSFGDSFVRLTGSGGTLSPQAFVPDGADILEQNDADLGSGGTMVLPDTNLVIGGGKTGYVYLLDRNSMTLQQSFAASTNLYEPSWRDQCWNGGPHLHGSPTFWNDNLYVWGEKDVLKLYRFDRRANKFQERVLKAGAVLETSAGVSDHIGGGGGGASPGGGGGAAGGGGPASPAAPAAGAMAQCSKGQTAPGLVVADVVPVYRGTIRALAETMPGGMLSVSADGTKSRTGVLWATLPVSDWPTSGPFPGRLYAFDAENLSWLWDTGWGGALAHWVPPTIAEGSVFLATNDYLLAYGLCAADHPCRPTGRAYEPKASCQSCHSQGRMLEVLRAATMNEDFPNGAAMRAFAAGAFQELALPETNSKVLELEGQGVQSFEARPDADRRGTLVWSPTTSAANLALANAAEYASATDRPATLNVRLSEGSIWSASDGSAVVGEVERTAQPPEPTSAPWALFKVRPRGTQGVLSKVAYIQRVHTHAGRAPAMPPRRLGEVAHVPFYAQYWFYQ